MPSGRTTGARKRWPVGSGAAGTDSPTTCRPGSGCVHQRSDGEARPRSILRRPRPWSCRHGPVQPAASWRQLARRVLSADGTRLTSLPARRYQPSPTELPEDPSVSERPGNSGQDSEWTKEDAAPGEKVSGLPGGCWESDHRKESGAALGGARLEWRGLSSLRVASCSTSTRGQRRVRPDVRRHGTAVTATLAFAPGGLSSRQPGHGGGKCRSQRGSE